MRSVRCKCILFVAAAPRTGNRPAETEDKSLTSRRIVNYVTSITGSIHYGPAPFPLSAFVIPPTANGLAVYLTLIFQWAFRRLSLWDIISSSTQNGLFHGGVLPSVTAFYSRIPGVRFPRGPLCFWTTFSIAKRFNSYPRFLINSFNKCLWH